MVKGKMLDLLECSQSNALMRVVGTADTTPPTRRVVVTASMPASNLGRDDLIAANVQIVHFRRRTSGQVLTAS